jgi:hypothetical protein
MQNRDHIYNTYVDTHTHTHTHKFSSIYREREHATGERSHVDKTHAPHEMEENPKKKSIEWKR